MRQFSEIRPFENQFEILHLSAARIIGREVRSGGSLGNTAPALWGEMYASGAMDALKALPSVQPDATFGWTCEYDGATDTFVYIVCVMTPPGTPVPEGFAYRDIPETACAKGLFGEDTIKTVARAREAGFAPNWEACGWNAEIYLAAEKANPPRTDCTPWEWLVPVESA